MHDGFACLSLVPVLACCMSGCAICVYDLYEESLEAYKKAIADLRIKLSSMNIPEDQWPNNIQSHKKSGPNTQAVNPASVVRSAFEEMERILKEKRVMREGDGHTIGKSASLTLIEN